MKISGCSPRRQGRGSCRHGRPSVAVVADGSNNRIMEKNSLISNNRFNWIFNLVLWNTVSIKFTRKQSLQQHDSVANDEQKNERQLTCDYRRQPSGTDWVASTAWLAFLTDSVAEMLPGRWITVLVNWIQIQVKPFGGNYLNVNECAFYTPSSDFVKEFTLSRFAT